MARRRALTWQRRIAWLSWGRVRHWRCRAVPCTWYQHCTFGSWVPMLTWISFAKHDPQCSASSMLHPACPQIRTWWGCQAGHKRRQASSSWGTRCQMRIRALEVRLDRVKQVLCQPAVAMQCQQHMDHTVITASLNCPPQV